MKDTSYINKKKEEESIINSGTQLIAHASYFSLP